jgi:hypothetical protein
LKQEAATNTDAWAYIQGNSSPASNHDFVAHRRKPRT